MAKVMKHEHANARVGANGGSGSEKPIDFKKIQAIVWKNWLVIKGDRIRIIPMLIFPIVMIAIFGFATTGTIQGLPAALVDNDHSPASAALSQALHGVNTISIRYEVGTESEAKRLMDEGYVKALIVIPNGFGEALETGASQARVVVKVDESDSTVAQMIKGVLQQSVAAYSRKQAFAKLAAIQAKQNAAAQAISAGAQTLESIAKSAGDASATQSEAKTLGYIAAILQNDVKQTDAQILALKNKIGYEETIDTSSKGGGAPAVSYDAYSLQIKALQATEASDKAALASIARLLAANSNRAAGDTATAAAASASGEALEGAAAALANSVGNGGVGQIEVVLSPVVYDDEPAYGEGRKPIDFLLPAIIAMTIFQGAAMGMGRALAGEKKDGSLTRVFLTPTSNATILVGTTLFYMIFESFRSSFMVFTAMILFGVTLQGSILITLFIIMVYAAGCTTIGLLISAVTNSQEQYMAVAMLVSLPTMFLSGVFFPVQTMPAALQGIANVLPVSYAATALRGVMIKGFDLATVMPQVAILVGFMVAFMALALIVFKREIA
ncbi:MAG: ABC transporter permease [Candidatus Micrarchaeota archaeon]